MKIFCEWYRFLIRGFLLKNECIPLYLQLENRLMWMDWIRYAVTEFLFPPGWYNRNVYPKGFVADNAQSKVLAMARIRQLRVQPSMFIAVFRAESQV